MLSHFVHDFLMTRTTWVDDGWNNGKDNGKDKCEKRASASAMSVTVSHIAANNTTKLYTNEKCKPLCKTL